MTAQQLKNSILQMAVQGKLVPQDPNDEPASVLLERIRAEKEQLIKEKKIKKEKNPSVIFRGADNLPYEKVGKNKPICIADEVPFDIPDSWEWARLGSVIELQSGQDMTPDKYNDNGNGIPYITGASNIIDGTVIINRWTTCGKAFAHRGDILLTCKGTVGTMAILQEEIVHIARQIMAIRPIENLYVPYIQLVLETMVENLKAAAKSMIPGISRNDVLTSLFPVPPLNEQHRIIAKLKEVDPYVCQYDKSESILRHMDNIFPEALKKSILQWAVQGKLVPQDPNDEPAEALLERIRAEKLKLIKEGKIKQDKHESVIFRRDNSHYEKLDGTERCIDNELPFEIPESWCWVRFGTALINRDAERIPLSVAQREKLQKKYDYYGASGVIDKVDQYLFDKPLLLIGEDGANLLLRSKPIAFIASGQYWVNNHAHVIDSVGGVDLRYIALFINAINLAPYVTGTAQPKMNQEKLNSILVPLPPVAEQQRIVTAFEEIVAIIR